jgi:uncharacterized RDD family membrane protein YckC
MKSSSIEVSSNDQTSYATLKQRTMAFLIDFAILMLLERGIDFLPQPIAVVFAFGLALAYYPGFESSKLQATPGKLALGLIVMDVNRQRPSYPRALARAWSMNLSMYPFLLGILYMNRNPQRQAFHDLIANCVVVSTRANDIRADTSIT